jgi:uncharacterized radical SAM superfamily Fe-S cluster-containing enzyme
MTKDEIIEIIDMARQAGFVDYELDDGTTNAFDKRYEAFAKLVAEKEREAIWNILFEYAGRDDLTPEDESLLKHLADLIRARGQE